MKNKNNFKILSIIITAFIAFTLFCGVNVNAKELESYNNIIDKQSNCILYNDYLSNEEVTPYFFQLEIDNFPRLDMYCEKRVPVETLEAMLEEFDTTLLYRIDSDVTSVKYERVYNDIIGEASFTDEEEEVTAIEATILERDGAKYAVLPVSLSDEYTCTSAGYGMTQAYFSAYYNLYMQKAEEVVDTGLNIFLSVKSELYRDALVQVSNKQGMLYASAGMTNGFVTGIGLFSIPGNVDLSELYLDYYLEDYVGDVLEVGAFEAVPYVGKYYGKYKYRICLADAKVEEDYIYGISPVDYYGVEMIEDYLFVDNIPLFEYELYAPSFEYEPELNIAQEGVVEVSGDNEDNQVYAEYVEPEDEIYDLTIEILEEIHKDYDDVAVVNIYIDGEHDEEQNISFYTGEEYDGMKYVVVHLQDISIGEIIYETFTGIVKNGKIEITASGLSPFGVAVYKDAIVVEDVVEELPEIIEDVATGDPILYYLAGLVTFAIFGLITFKKKLN